MEKVNETDHIRQIKAMVHKNFILKRRMKGQLMWEILLPVIIVIYIHFILKNSCEDPDSTCTPEEKKVKK